MRWAVVVLAAAGGVAASGCAAPAAPARLGTCGNFQPEFRVERRQVSGGAELLTVFGPLPGSERADALPEPDVPLFSVLRDTLGDGDPSNDRLRYVWVLTSASPTLLQRAAAAVPFFYFRPNLGKNADRPPKPAVDLGAASRGVWTALAGSLAQVTALDSNGAIVRSATRSYRTNLEDARRGRLTEGLAEVALLSDQPEGRSPFSAGELLEIQARLELAGRTLGGLVDAERLPEAYVKQRTRTEETRGHNWELLRQRAEATGLYFTPLGVGASATHALLWVARGDLGGKHDFDGRFLQIADPFTDARVKNWTGYTFHDPQLGEMIPLALYGLEYPKVPLLLVDFRNPHSPKRREMLSRATNDAVSGVLGISKFGNWPWFAGDWAFNFVRTRHGGASNRAARLKAYAEVREVLALDGALDPDLRADVLRRLEVMGVNPLETSVFDQADIARRQYEALLRYADDPGGLSARLERDRNAELTAARHGLAARAGWTVAHVATLGIYSHTEGQPDAVVEALSETRARKNRPGANAAPAVAAAVGGEAGHAGGAAQ